MKHILKTICTKSVIRLLSTAFLILLLPLLVTSFLSISSMNRELREKSISAFQDSVENIGNNIENQFMLINEMGNNIYLLDKLDRLINIPYQTDLYDRFSTINMIHNSISFVKESNPFIESIQVYLPQLGKVINSRGTPGGSVLQLNSNRYEELIQNKLTNLSGIFFQDDGEICLLFILSQKEPNSLIRIALSKEYLENYLFMFATMENEGFLLRDEKDRIIASSSFPSQWFETELDEFRADGISYRIFRTNLDQIGLELICAAETEAVYYSASKSTLFSGIFLCLLVFGTLLYLFILWNLIRKPLKKLIESFQQMENGCLNIRIPTDGVPKEFYSLYMSFNHMTEYVSGLIEREYMQKILLQKSELKQLQAQINPHFLYNSFFLLQRFIQHEMTEEAAALSKKLGIFFRYVTKAKEDFVPLCEEHEHAKIYLDIQEMRFQKRIEIRCETVPSQFEKLQVPKMILQPIVENSFQHGLSNKAENGLLILSYQTFENRLVILIEDNGNEMTDEELLSLQEQIRRVTSDEPVTVETTGLLNIARRLYFFSGGKSFLKADRSPLGGLRIQIILEDNNVSDNDCG